MYSLEEPKRSCLFRRESFGRHSNRQFWMRIDDFIILFKWISYLGRHLTWLRRIQTAMPTAHLISFSQLLKLFPFCIHPRKSARFSHKSLVTERVARNCIFDSLFPLA